MEINIKEELVPTLVRLAEERSMTTTQYVEEYLDSHLASQYRTFVANKVANESVENVATIEEVIDTKKEEIRVAEELANPTPIEETVAPVEKNVI